MANRKLAYVSQGPNGQGLFGIMQEDNAVVYFRGDAGFAGWSSAADGKARVVAAADYSSAWCVNENGQIWFMPQPDAENPTMAWQQVATYSGEDDAAHIAVASDGSIWYNTADGRVYRRDGDGWARATRKRLTQIAPHRRNMAWGVDTHNQIGYFTATSDWHEFGSLGINGLPQSLSAGSDAVAWFTDLYRGGLFNGDPSVDDGWQVPAGWDEARMGSARIVSAVNRDDVVVLNSAGDVWALRDGAWRQIKEIGPDSVEYLVSSAEQFETGYWQMVETVEQNYSGLGGRYETLDELIDWCNHEIVRAINWLTNPNNPQVSAATCAAVDHTQAAWESFITHTRMAQAPLTTRNVPPVQTAGLERKDYLLAEAAALRGRYHQLRKLIDLQLWMNP